MKKTVTILSLLLFLLTACKSKEEKINEIKSYIDQKKTELSYNPDNIAELVSTHGVQTDYPFCKVTEITDLTGNSFTLELLADLNQYPDEFYEDKASDVQLNRTLFVFCNSLSDSIDKPNSGKKYTPADITSINNEFYFDNDALECFTHPEENSARLFEENRNVDDSKLSIDSNFEKMNEYKYIAFVQFEYIALPVNGTTNFSSGYVRANVNVFNLKDKSLHKSFQSFASNSKEVTEYSENPVITTDDLISDLIINMKDDIKFRLTKM